MVKSRQKKLDDRWGLERNAKGGRFRLHKDLAGFHFTAREAIVMEAEEARVKIRIQNPAELRAIGDLIHFDNVAVRYSGMGKNVLEDVKFTVDQGGRCAFVGAVSYSIDLWWSFCLLLIDVVAQNGQGKSTLAKLIVGEIKPSKGTILRHPQLRIGYFTQVSTNKRARVSCKRLIDNAGFGRSPFRPRQDYSFTTFYEPFREHQKYPWYRSDEFKCNGKGG